MSLDLAGMSDALKAIIVARGAGLNASPYLGQPTPKIMSGKGIFPQQFQNNNGTGSLTSGTYRFVPIWLPGGVTYTGIKTRNSGTGDSGNKIKIAAYSEAAAGGPGALAKNFGEATLSGAAAILTFASSWTPTRGWYYLAIVGNAAIAMNMMDVCTVFSNAAWIFYGPVITQIPSFPADVINSNQCPAYEYVAGTYANFPEATSLTPTNTALSVGTGAVPALMLYV